MFTSHLSTSSGMSYQQMHLAQEKMYYRKFENDRKNKNESGNKSQPESLHSKMLKFQNTLSDNTANIQDNENYITLIQQQSAFNLFYIFFKFKTVLFNKIIWPHSDLKALYLASKKILDQETAFAALHKAFQVKQEDASYVYAKIKFIELIRMLNHSIDLAEQSSIIEKMIENIKGDTQNRSLQSLGMSLFQEGDNVFITSFKNLSLLSPKRLQIRYEEYKKYIMEKSSNDCNQTEIQIKNIFNNHEPNNEINNINSNYLKLKMLDLS